jgi:hypothetical protein
MTREVVEEVSQVEEVLLLDEETRQEAEALPAEVLKNPPVIQGTNTPGEAVGVDRYLSHRQALAAGIKTRGWS